MTDEDETADTVKTSKRDRLKGALARTRTKFKKKETETEDSGYKPDDDVDEFLNAGRPSTSSRPSFSDSLSLASGRPSTSDSLPHHPTPRAPDPFAPPQQSPKRVVVPRIDVSSSQRWPGAKPLPGPDQKDKKHMLGPEYEARSQSASPLSKGRGRARGLSVSFLEAPPTVIGEGGDEAQNPPMEISRAKARARSVSPVRTRAAHAAAGIPGSTFPVIRKPVADRPVHTPPEPFHPRALQKAQTGPQSKLAMDKEFEMSLGMGPTPAISLNSPTSTNQPTTLHAPRPIHPPASYPVVKEVKPAHAITDLWAQFSEGESHEAGHYRDLSNFSPGGRPFAIRTEQGTYRGPRGQSRAGTAGVAASNTNSLSPTEEGNSRQKWI